MPLSVFPLHGRPRASTTASGKVGNPPRQRFNRVFMEFFISSNSPGTRWLATCQSATDFAGSVSIVSRSAYVWLKTYPQTWRKISFPEKEFVHLPVCNSSAFKRGPIRQIIFNLETLRNVNNHVIDGILPFRAVCVAKIAIDQSENVCVLAL